MDAGTELTKLRALLISPDCSLLALHFCFKGRDAILQIFIAQYLIGSLTEGRCPLTAER